MERGWLTPGRLGRLARVMAVVQALLLAFFIAGTHGAFSRVGPNTVDFVSFYAAGGLARHGDPAGAYDRTRLYAAEQRATVPGVNYQYFFYPPTYLLLNAPLSLLPFLAAFVLFEAATLAFWLAVATRITGAGREGAWALMAIPSVWWALGLGQNSFLSAGLMGLGTLALRTRPVLAGVAFGLICFKPHFGLVIPAALLAGREFRAAAAAAVTVGACVAASLALWGGATWLAFLDALRHAGDAFDTGRVLLAGHVDAGGAARQFGAGAGAALWLQAGVSLAACAAVGAIWLPASRATPPVRYAALAAGALVVAPLALFYDLVMAGTAAAWLARAAREDGGRTGERVALVALVVLTLAAAHPIVSATGVPFGAFVAPGLLLLAGRRAWTVGPSKISGQQVI